MFNNLNVEDNGIINAVLTQWGNFCNICGTKRTSENIKVVKKNPDSVVLHVTCSNCKNGHFIQFSYNSSAFTMQQYSSDLNVDEVKKLGNPPVSTDDLIDTHLALKKVNTVSDLLNLIKKK